MAVTEWVLNLKRLVSISDRDLQKAVFAFLDQESLNVSPDVSCISAGMPPGGYELRLLSLVPKHPCAPFLKSTVLGVIVSYRLLSAQP